MKKLIFTLSFILAVLGMSAETYTLVTSASEITTKDTYILAYVKSGENTCIVMGAPANSGKYRTHITDVPVADNVITITDQKVSTFKLVTGKATGTYAFYFIGEDKPYQYCTSTGNGSLATSATQTDNCDMTITDSGSNNTMVIKYLSPESWFKYNPSSPRFTNYKSDQQQNCQLYKLQASSDPTISVVSTLDFGANLEVPAANTLAVSGSNLSEAITYYWKTGGIFTAEGTLTAEGGILTIALAETAEGNYSDKLILTSGTATAEVEVTASIITLAGKGEGTEASPYDVARALDIIAKGLATTENVYVAGVVNAVTEVSTQHGNATFTIVDAGETAPLTVFRAKYLENEDFTDEDQIKVADEVVVVGVLKDYNGTPESTNGYIVSLERKEKKVTTIDVTGDDTVEIGETIELTAKIMFGEEEVEGTVTFTSSNEEIATVDANGVVTGVAQGKVTITANYAGDEEYTLSSAEFFVTVKKPVGEITEGDVVFGSDWDALFGTTYNGQIILKKDEKLTLNGSENGIDLTVTNGTSTNGYVKTGDFRVYNGYTMTFTAPDGFVITDIVTTKGGKTYSSGVSSTKGTISIKNNATTWKGSEKTVVWNIGGTVSFANITVTLAKGESSAIESIEAEDGAARFFNLQGVEVANPVSGQLYIRVQGGKATKVLVK